MKVKLTFLVCTPAVSMDWKCAVNDDDDVNDRVTLLVGLEL